MRATQERTRQLAVPRGAQGRLIFRLHGSSHNSPLDRRHPENTRMAYGIREQ